MAWPACPHCGTVKIADADTAPAVNHLPRETQVFRSYECHGCKKILWSEEKVFCFDAPTKYLRYKFSHPAAGTPVTDRGERG